MDRAAGWQAVYDAEAERLRRYLRGRLDSEQTVDDVLQEAFLRLWEHYPEGVSRSQGAALVWRIAQRVGMDTYRRERPRAPMSAQWPAPDDGWREQAEARVDVARGGCYLTDKQREVLCLRYGEKLTYPEISALTGLSEGAARQLAQRGWDAMRRRLGVTMGIGRRCKWGSLDF